MFAPSDRRAMREVFFRAWQRHRRGEPLEGIERLVVEVARQHPEYHALLEDPDRYRDRDYLPALGETNPFLHMGMHLAIAESLTLDRPRGVREHYRQLLARLVDEHAAQHRMMECLAEMLWQAQRAGTAPDERRYLDCLARLLEATAPASR